MPPGFTMIDNDAVIGRLPEIDGTACKVFLALARRMNEAGECWPSVGTIAVDTGLQRRAVQVALGRLKGLELITLDTRHGHATIYKLTYAGGAPPCAPSNTGGAPPCAPGAHDGARGGAPLCAGGAHGGAPRTTPIERYPKNNTHKITGVVEIPAEVDSGGFPAAWAKWLNYRHARHLTCTPATLAGQLKKLAALGPAAAAAEIESSIANGWQSVCYPGRNTNGNGKPHASSTGVGQRHPADVRTAPGQL